MDGISNEISKRYEENLNNVLLVRKDLEKNWEYFFFIVKYGEKKPESFEKKEEFLE